MTTQELAERAKAEREGAGLTQRELAERLGVTQGAISQAERDRDSTHMDRLRKRIIEELSGQKVSGPFWTIDEA